MISLPENSEIYTIVKIVKQMKPQIHGIKETRSLMECRRKHLNRLLNPDDGVLLKWILSLVSGQT